jgi:hypothetical protein
MSNVANLKKRLRDAHALFEKRGIYDWASLTKRALEKIKNDDYSFVEELWLKFAPTCDIDDLMITMPQLHDPPLSEEEANKLNDELALIANETFAALEKVKEINERGHNNNKKE